MCIVFSFLNCKKTCLSKKNKVRKNGKVMRLETLERTIRVTILSYEMKVPNYNTKRRK